MAPLAPLVPPPMNYRYYRPGLAAMCLMVLLVLFSHINTITSPRLRIAWARPMNTVCFVIASKIIIDLIDVFLLDSIYWHKTVYPAMMMLFVFFLPPQHTQCYVSSDPKDYQKEYEDSLMYRYVNIHVFWILLNITIPPGPEATLTTTNVTEGRMKIISINEETKGKERSNN